MEKCCYHKSVVADLARWLSVQSTCQATLRTWSPFSKFIWKTSTGMPGEKRGVRRILEAFWQLLGLISWQTREPTLNKMEIGGSNPVLPLTFPWSLCMCMPTCEHMSVSCPDTSCIERAGRRGRERGEGGRERGREGVKERKHMSTTYEKKFRGKDEIRI